MNTFVQHVAKHKMAYLVGLLALTIGLMGWAYSRGSFNNFSNLTGDVGGGKGGVFTPARCPQYAGTPADVYHVQSGRRCAWSCSVGTTPDLRKPDKGGTSECLCKPGLTQTSTDQFGRRVCTAAPVLQFVDNNSPTVLQSGRLTLLDFKVKSKNQASTILEWTFDMTTNGNVNLTDLEFTDVKEGTRLRAIGGGVVDEHNFGVAFGGDSIIPINQTRRYVLTAAVAAPSPATYTGITTALNIGTVFVRGATPTRFTGLPIVHVLGDMTPAPAMSFSVNLTADLPVNPVTGAIEARVGDEIDFTHTAHGEGVINNSWEWHLDNSKLTCAGYPDWDSPTFRCNVIATGNSEVYITMRPMFVDGHTEDHESNRIAVEVAAPIPAPAPQSTGSSDEASMEPGGSTQPADPNMGSYPGGPTEAAPACPADQPPCPYFSNQCLPTANCIPPQTAPGEQPEEAQTPSPLNPTSGTMAQVGELYFNAVFDRALADGFNTVWQSSVMAFREPVRITELHFNVVTNGDVRVQEYELRVNNQTIIAHHPSPDFTGLDLRLGDSALTNVQLMGVIVGANTVDDQVLTTLNPDGVRATGVQSAAVITPQGLPATSRSTW